MPAVTPTPLTRPVAAARGELIHLQVAVTASAPGDRVTASAEGLGELTIRSVAYHNLTLPNDVHPANGIEAVSKPGFFPDALVPLSGPSADIFGYANVAGNAVWPWWEFGKAHAAE